MSRYFLAAVMAVSAVGGSFAQDAAKVDFARDVLPLFKAHCLECHGPKQQKNGFRLDRRDDAMRGGTSPMLAPGNSQASKMYLKLVGDEEGPRMPPDGTMSKEEIKVIKTWIDQGAVWPDSASGSVATTPDPKATRLMDLLRDGQREAFQKLVKDDPKAAALKGPGGTTPLMYAVLYGDLDTMKVLLAAGADVNARNDSGATALMWAVDNLEKTRLLLKAGADANARSDDGRTPLLSATSLVGSSEVVNLLLDHKANPSATAHSYRGPTTPLRQAADLGDVAVVKMLLERGADVKGPAALFAVIAALNANSPACVEQVIQTVKPQMMKDAFLFLVPPRGTPAGFSNLELIKKAIACGADVNAKDPEGYTALILASSSEYFSADTIRLLLEQGADVHAKTVKGETALDFAKRGGQSQVVELLKKAGCKEGGHPAIEVPKPKPAATLRAAVERSLPLLQKSDALFAEKAGCVSCHNNSLTAMTVSLARKSGFAVNEETSKATVQATSRFVELWRERSLQNWPIPGDADTVSILLSGLLVERVPPNESTDAWARYLKNRQQTNGSWMPTSHRPPIEASDFQATASSIRALQAYAPKALKSEYNVAIQKGADWLKTAKPHSNEDRTFQLLGLTWDGRHKDAIRTASRELLAEQQPDGGWRQHASLASDAYATGQALVALRESGTIAVADEAFQRGIKYLMSTQLEDGSWYVRSRSVPFQPYFESGFPHGHDQWISIAATNWATMALIHAAK